jgi:hypothetical protein
MSTRTRKTGDWRESADGDDIDIDYSGLYDTVDAHLSMFTTVLPTMLSVVCCVW